MVKIMATVDVLKYLVVCLLYRLLVNLVILPYEREMI